MASINEREVQEGKQYQGVDEFISYTLDVTRIGDGPSSPSVVVKDTVNNTAVTANVMPTNTPSAAGNVITLSPLGNLTEGIIYRVEVKYDLAGNTLENYFIVVAEE